MTNAFKIAVVGSGPAGLSAAAHAAELGLSHVLLEAEAHLSNTIYRYQKGKHVMAEPGVLPLRAAVPFDAGKRETILGAWDDGAAKLKINVRHRANVKAIKGAKGAFVIEVTGGEPVTAEVVVLSIGLQGNLRKLGAPGEDLEWVQYQLDDPDEYSREAIVVVGAGDAAIENAIALADAGNEVTIINRGGEFNRAKKANEADILKAIANKKVRCYYNSAISEARSTPNGPRRGELALKTADGAALLPSDRVIARLGATPPRTFVESCGVQFPSKDPNSVPAVSGIYESNVPGLFIIGALAGFPLIKQAMNQGYEVIEFIEGRNVDPADAPLLRAKFDNLPNFNGDVEAAIAHIQKRVPLLAPLTALQLREFLLDSEIRRPAAGEIVFNRNDFSTDIYSIVAGSVDIEIDPDDPFKRISIGPGQFFGEMSLISGRRRSSTVYAGEGCVLIESPRRTMLKLINSVAAVRRVLDEAFLRRIIESQIAPGLTPEDLQQLVSNATLQKFDANQTLFTEGEVGDSLHLIRSGSVTISRDFGGREIVLAYVPAGQYVGEMALVSETPRTATVRAAVRTETIRLDGKVFKQLMNRYPALAKRVQETYKSRVARNVTLHSQPSQGSVINFLMQQGLGEATDVLLIDESLCVRCDQCEKACADTHGNLSRLDREAGPTFDNLHVPTSCRHCEHPHCMKDCPPDAIKRSPGGEVYISDSCIGCGNCQRNCPYGVIQMGVPSKKKPSLWRWMMFGGEEPGHGDSHEKGIKKAAKCDMCVTVDGGPACVRACPTGAALRVSPEQFLRVAQPN
ncbi:MAG: cyclic nucleotide-binding domain-containing protein [Panacagrimonas sp.]